MCEQLRKTAMELESTATTAQSAKDKEKKKEDSKFDPEVMKIVKKKLENLKVAVKNYHEYLEEMDV